MELQEVSGRNARMTAPTERIAVEVAAGRTIQRPSFRWPDLWRAPLNDFPIRDEILYQYLPIGPEMNVLEIGPGNGFTAFRLSRKVERMTLVDTAEETVAELRGRLRRVPNVRCIRADLSKPGLAEALDERYDVAFGLDVFEYVSDPLTGLSNLASVLRRGGELFLTYPNVPPPIGDGVTYFQSVEELEGTLSAAGFTRWTVLAVQLHPYAARVYSTLHEKPLRLYRRLRGGNPEERPQTFDRAWSFRHRQSLERYRIPIQFLWVILARIIRMGGDAFSSQPATNANFRKQLVIRAWK